MTEKLDEETESVIAWLEAPPEIITALRSRIAELCEEARKEGMTMRFKEVTSKPPEWGY